MLAMLCGHPVLQTAFWSIVMFVALFLFFYLRLPPGTFNFDPGGCKGAFEPHAKRYQKLASLVLTLNTAAIGFMLNFLVNLPSGSAARNSYSLGLESAAASAVTMLSLSTASGVIFLLLENYF